MQQFIPDEQLTPFIREQLKRLAGGCVLLSREELADPNFANTVVLVCVHGDDGTFGLVINRPSHMPLNEVFDMDIPGARHTRKLYIGGPVKQEEMQLVQVTDAPVDNAFEVASGVYLGGTWNSMDEILAAEESSTRLFLGYSGWGSGQLEGEIMQGAWEVFRVDLVRLLRNSEENLIRPVGEIREYLQSLETPPSEPAAGG